MMSKKGVETRHSPSALLTTLYRAVANKEFQDRRGGSDYLAEYFLPLHVRFLIKYEKMRARGKAKSNAQTPGLYEYMIARTAFFDEVFIEALNESVSQIVLLGAGYDTRALRFADLNKAARIIELDGAATQNRKRKCLKKSRIDIPEHVTYIPMDFDKDPLKDVLERAGYEENRETLFIWEGVCMYLEPTSVDAVLGFIADTSHDESVIVFDYAVSISDDNSRQYYGAEQLTRRLKKTRSNEPFKFTIDEEKIESFLGRRGLKMIKHLNPEQIEKSFLLTDHGASMGQPNGMFRFAVASPNHKRLHR